MIATADDPKQLTLRQVYERYKKPGLIEGQASPRTLDSYGTALSGWERFTGNPPVGLITNATLAKFKAAVLAGGLAPVSFNKFWIHVRAILRRIGPPETGNPLGEGFLERVPYVQSLRQESELPRIATADELDAIYAAAAEMTWPTSFEVLPVDWWRALFAVGLGAGPRIFDMMRLRTDAFDLDAQTLRFRANKTRKWHVLPMGDVVTAHVRRIWSARPLLFAPSGSPKVAENRHAFYVAWHELQDRAKIRDHFTPHTLRRTCGSLYFRHGGYELASYVLGHSLKSVTMRFYVDPSQALRDVAYKLDWPPSFREILTDPAAMAMSAGLQKRERSRWTFGIDTATYCGRVVKPSARALALLRALVAAGRPLSVDELMPLVWRDRPRGNSRHIINVACQARAALIEALALPVGWDPLPNACGGWDLNLPDLEGQQRASA